MAQTIAKSRLVANKSTPWKSGQNLPTWLKITVGIFLILVVAITATLVYARGRYNQAVVKANPSASSTPQPSATPDPDRPIALLLMGYGGGGHAGGKLTDTMMVAYIQPKLQVIHLISIPRDLWVQLPIKDGAEPQGYKINAAYALGSDDINYRSKPAQFTGPAGGGELAKFAVNQALGINIDHFAVVNFSSFQKAIDVLGGVDVKVEITFDDFQYPIDGMEDDTCGRTPDDIAAIDATMSADLAPTMFPCRYETLHFDKGITHMDGATALKYVRSRHSAQDGSDFGRAARQRNLLQAVRDKVLAVNFIPKLIPFLSTLSTNFQTDIDLTQLQTFIGKATEYSHYKLVSVPLTTTNVLKETHSSDGQYILAPKEGIGNWTALQAWLQENLATASPSASLNASPSAQPKVPITQ